MRTVQLREAKAQLSALVQAAEDGETTTITKHGRPAALLTPVDAGQGVQPSGRPNLVEYLMSMPEAIPIGRNRSRPRKAAF
jgi:prevent-host-death family protein